MSELGLLDLNMRVHPGTHAWGIAKAVLYCPQMTQQDTFIKVKRITALFIFHAEFMYFQNPSNNHSVGGSVGHTMGI